MVTMKDIAEVTGVSRQTVSFVLSGRYQRDLKISPEVVERVKAMALKLKYRRNALACSMKSGRTNIIGFIGNFDEVGHNYVLNMITGIGKTLQQRGYLMKMFSLNNDNIAEISKQCVEQMLCGVICRYLNEKQLAILRNELEPYNIPVVLLGRSIPHDWCFRITSDDVNGSRMAVAHLVELGHRRIGHLTLEDANGVTIPRKQGYIDGMQSAGLPTTEDNFLRLPSSYEMREDFYSLFDDWYERYKPTAVVSASDPLAMKLQVWAYKRHIRLPGKLSLIGFANQEYSALACPPLTTIVQPFERMGSRAAEKLLEAIENKDVTQKDEMLPVELLIRSSTARKK